MLKIILAVAQAHGSRKKSQLPQPEGEKKIYCPEKLPNTPPPPPPKKKLKSIIIIMVHLLISQKMERPY